MFFRVFTQICDSLRRRRDRSRRIGRDAHRCSRFRTCRIEHLEERELLYATYVGQGDPDGFWSFTNLSYSYSNLLDGWSSGLNNQQLIGAVEEAMGVWTAVTPLTFFEGGDSGPLPGGLAGGSHVDYDDYDPIGHPFLRWGHHPIDGSMGLNTLAHAQRPGDRGGNGDIHFDDGNTFTPATFLETAAHEFGHAIGLAHANGDVAGGICPPALPAIMDACAGSYSYGGLGGGFLLQDDINGIRSLYGAGLGYVLNLGGVLHVWGTSGDDLITVNVAGGAITATSAGAQQGNVSFVRTIAGVNAINIHGQAGNDILRIEDNDANIPIFGFGDAGDDFFDVQFLNRNFDRSTGDITFWGGAGVDTAWLYDDVNSDPDRYTVTSSSVLRPSFGDDFRFFYDGQLENLRMVAGSGVNVVDIASTSASAKLFIQNSGGADTVNVGLGNLGGVLGDVEINNAPSFTTININDGLRAGYTYARFQGDPSVNPYSGLLFAAPGDIYWKNADTSIVTYTTGTGNNAIDLWDNAKPLNLTSTGGNDLIHFGNGLLGMQTIFGNVSISAQNGRPNIEFDDRANSTGRTISVNDHLFNTFQQVIGFSPATIFYTVANSIEFNLGTGGDLITFNDNPFYHLDLDAGGGNDVVILANISNFRDFETQSGELPFSYNVNIVGGNGFNTLTFNDGAAGERWYYLSDGYLLANDDGAPLGLRLNYDAFQSMTVQAGDFGNYFYVSGTSADIPAGQQTTIIGGGDADVFVTYPRDTNGNVSFPSALGVIGGGGIDSFYLDDSANSTGATWLINNFHGAGTQSFGFGGAPIIGTLNDLENLYLLGSQGDDTYNVEEFKSGASLRILGAGGFDAVNISPTSRNLTTDITAMSFFNFDGGADLDTFNLYNDNHPQSWTYTRTADNLRTHNNATGFFALWNQQGVEFLDATGGTQSDTFLVWSTPNGGANYFRGAGGFDFYSLGQNGHTDLITANVTVVNDADFDSVIIDDTADNIGRTLHIDASTVGAAPGDDLFGQGGWLHHINLLGALSVLLGDGADTVFVAPSITTTLVVEGNGPPAGGGEADQGGGAGAMDDFLGFGFGDAVNPVLTVLSPEQSQYSFDNFANILFRGFEQTASDSDKPYIVSQLHAQVGQGSSIIAEFSEDVFATVDPIQPFYLELINTTTGEQIAYWLMAMEYDQATNTATFTFPGLSDGRLPAGDYSGRFIAGAADYYGNRMDDQAPFYFTPTPTLAADFDTDGDVDGDDFLIWQASFGVNAGGDADNDSDTDGDDFLVWQSQFGSGGAAVAAPDWNPARASKAPYDLFHAAHAYVEVNDVFSAKSKESTSHIFIRRLPAASIEHQQLNGERTRNETRAETTSAAKASPKSLEDLWPQAAVRRGYHHFPRPLDQDMDRLARDSYVQAVDRVHASAPSWSDAAEWGRRD